jgi:hypothetical protein
MTSSTFASLCVTLSALTMAAPGLAQQAQRPAQVPATTGDVRSPTPTTQPVEVPPHAVGVTRRLDRSALPQGFSVVLVLGDIQGAAAADDVPLAARKALTDMRDFLPFKSYKLLDAAWVMCCGQLPETLTQALRGPEDQEYELKLSTSRSGGAQVFVRFALFNHAPTREAGADSHSASSRTTARRIADLTDRRELLEKQIQEARKKVDIGIAAGGDIPKMELELRRVTREIADLTAQLEETRRPSARGTPVAARMARSAIIDTSFAMDVGETVVVGTSRLKGGSRALIALLTAVPPRGNERRE